MARLIRFPQVDERPTPPAALQVDDGSESWWSGVQLNFAAIPIAATIAAVALSANLAWGYQQQTEDIVPQPVVVVAEDDSWQRPFSVVPRIYVSGPTWDDQVRAGPQLEEDGWWVHTPLPTQPRFLYLPDPEEVPAGSLHGPFEEEWSVYTPSLAPARFLFLPDDGQIVPQPVVAVQDEDFWSVYTPSYPAARSLYLPDPEEIPAGALFGVPEQDPWLVLLSPRASWTVWLPGGDEEIVPQPVAFVPEEDPWLLSVSSRDRWTVRLFIADDEIIPAAFVPDEDYWIHLISQRERWTVGVASADEHVIPQQPVAFVADEDVWFASRPVGVQYHFFVAPWGDGTTEDFVGFSIAETIRGVVLDPRQPSRSDARQPEKSDTGQPSRSDPRQPRRGGPRQPPRS